MKLTTFAALCILGSASASSNFKQLTNHTLAIRDPFLLPRCSGSCDYCFGAGNVECVGLTCYNPSAGQSCCSDGNYCPAGQVCTDIEGGCCNTGQTIQDCAASLGVPVPTSTPTPTTSTASTPSSTTIVGGDTAPSDTNSSSTDVGDWVSHHVGIIAGAAAGVVALLLLVCCLGFYRRRRTRNRYVADQNMQQNPSTVYYS